MKSSEAFARIQSLGKSSMTTNEVAFRLNVARPHASQILRRLSEDRLVTRLKNGLWVLPRAVKPFELPGILAAPLPAYISFQSALFHHGMISQIPGRIFAATLARSSQTQTPWGTVSLHHLDASVFHGYEPQEGFFLATPEKALFDVLYMTRSRSRWFTKLPEVELSRKFRRAQFHAFVDTVTDAKRRTEILKRWEELRSSS